MCFFLRAVEQSPYGVSQGIRLKWCSKKRATRGVIDSQFIRWFVGDKNSAYLGTQGFQSCYNIAGEFMFQDGFCHDDVNRLQMLLAPTRGLIWAIGFQNDVAERAQNQSQCYEISWVRFRLAGQRAYRPLTPCP